MKWWGMLTLCFVKKAVLLQFSEGSGDYSRTQYRQGGLRGQGSEWAGLRGREECAVGEGAEGLCFIHSTITVVLKI